MLFRLISTIILTTMITSTTYAQELQTQVETINSFIQKHSDGMNNSFAKINATQGNIYFYNGRLHSMKLTFPVDKIDQHSIKVTKKGLTFRANETGEFVIKKFGKVKKPIKTAWLNIVNMSKKHKIELRDKFILFISDYQKAIKK